MANSNYLHPTCEIHATAVYGSDNRFWHQVQIMEQVRIGDQCTFGKGAFIGAGSIIGNKVKVGNYTSVFGAIIADEVFLAPYTKLVEDPSPRSTNVDGTLKTAGDFTRLPVHLERGCTIGTGACILPGITVGAYAFIAAGSVVFEDIPDHGFAIGNPARVIGLVCKCAKRIDKTLNKCPACGLTYQFQEGRITF